MSKKITDRFFSTKNVDLLHESIVDVLKDMNYDIRSNEIRSLLKYTMRQIYDNTPPNKIGLGRLNKETSARAIRNMLKYIQREIEEREKKQVIQQQNNPHIPQLTVTPSPRPSASRTSRTYQGNREHLYAPEEVYNQVISSSENGQRQLIPNFQDPMPDPNSLPDVDSLYENAEQTRRISDLIAPPNNHTKNLLQNNGHHVRTEPTLYEQPDTLYEQTNNTNSGGNMSTRIQDLLPNNNMVTPPFEEPFDNTSSSNHVTDIASSGNTVIKYSPPTQSMQNDRIFAEQIDRQRDIMNANDPKNDLVPSPAPRQMARLVPRTSRNIVHESRTIPHIFSVDSRDRDDMIFPTASEYKLRIQEYKEVLSMELESAEIPITAYVINEHNNCLHFQEEEDITQIAKISVGNYDSDELALAMEAALNTASANGILYSVANNTTTSKFTITSGAVGPFIFSLIFFGGLKVFPSVNEPNNKNKAVYIEHSLGPIIGFDKTNKTGALEYTSDFIYNLGGEKYIFFSDPNFLYLCNI